MMQAWFTTQVYPKVLYSGERLNSLLTVQEILSSTAPGVASLTAVLPEIFKTILETMGSQNGRLLLLYKESDQAVVVPAVDGRVATETLDSIPAFLAEELEFFDAQHGRDVFIANTEDENESAAGPTPNTVTTFWSEISAPLRVENSTAGKISLLKPGPNQFTREDGDFLSLFAGQIAAVLTAIKFKADWKTAETRVQDLLHDNHDLAAILVHDLQGPLGNVIASLELLQAEVEGEDSSSLPLMMDIAIRSSKQLETLVNSLLDISRLEAGQQITDLEPVAVSDIVGYVAEVEDPVLEQRQVTLVRDLEPDLPLINVNVDILQRVLLNLIDNALKVSKRDEKITVRAFVDVDEGVLKICVVDQGPGIPEAYHERIFEKYQRVNESSASKGLGLGLAFCKLAVEAHGGRIWVENAPGQGACFCLILPIESPANSNA